MYKVDVFRFQPFASRQERDTVVGLQFHYAPVIVAALKASLRMHRERAINPAANQHHPGGWLPEYKTWFVEECIWPSVALELAAIGCEFRQLAEAPAEASP